MVEYLPWSKTIYQESLKQYKKGLFSSLDIELGGECNFHCIYCDSPEYKKKCQIPLETIEDYLSTGTIQWVYICGLGEPTFHTNYSTLIWLLKICQRYGIQCSIFSNLSNLTPELIRFIQDGILHIQFKCDSHDEHLVKMLYQTQNPGEQLHNIKLIKKLVTSDGKTTNLAASIVPTKLNLNSILGVVEECLNANIYPLLGELECSGMGQVNYENLCLHPEEAMELKQSVEHLCGESYKIPVCPSVISGIHINHSGYITVDKKTGLSCHWFWLDKPQIFRLMHCSNYENINAIAYDIWNYRSSCMDNVLNFLNNGKKIGMAFGGCGGDVTELFKQYVENHRGGIE
ncbi:MAG: radical SAM protein [Oscillospiraceae bacterium]|nr:radical SAM protein [Oscillospiraceae bacterium]